MLHRPPDAVFPVLQQNRARYGQLVDVVRRYAADRDPERVLRAATVAANYAWQAPIGFLADPGLEGVVLGAVGGGEPTEVDGSRSTGRVLHVLTQGYGAGGHTRLAWRWISSDPRRSDVVLTNQTGEVPAALVAAVHGSGGDVHDLRAEDSDLLARARALRRRMDEVDVVVQHVHPYDTVALAAAGLPGSRPPMIYENHAEHVYWVGLGGADVVSDYHAFSQQVSHGLRGVATERLGLLPIPLEDLRSAEDADLQAARHTVRTRLGLRPDAVLGLTVAAEHKISPMWGRGLGRLVDRVLAMCPRLTMVFVGPSPQGTLAGLAARHRGRVHVLGALPGVEDFYAAADIYVDSYPSRSGTSVLEAAVHGIPVLSLADLGEDAGFAQLYQADSPGMVGNPRADTQQRYIAMARALVNDAGLRAQRGSDLRAAVLGAHCGDGWKASMEDLYARARRVPVAQLAEYGDAVLDDQYGAMLMAYGSSEPQSPPVSSAAGPLGENQDSRLQADLFALANRDAGSALSVRIEMGWEARPEVTSRLLRLAATHPHLALSLPFAPGDDVRGSRTVAVLEQLLAGLGLTTENCGDVTVDSNAPNRIPAVRGALPPTTEAADWLEELLSSPFWVATSGSDAPRESVPAAG